MAPEVGLVIDEVRLAVLVDEQRAVLDAAFNRQLHDVE